MLFLIVTLIVCVPLVLFALSNPGDVRLALWPTDYGIDVPLSASILVAMAVAFVLGALLVWFSVVSQAARARRAERKVRLLEAQVERLNARPASQTSLPRA